MCFATIFSSLLEFKITSHEQWALKTEMCTAQPLKLSSENSNMCPFMPSLTQ